MSNRIFLFLTIITLLFIETTFSQQVSQYWAWISGSNTTNQNGTYGTKGIASSSNIPGARVATATWTDSNNNLWLFGGNGYDSTGGFGFFNDLWKFNGVNWTWISGSNLRDQNGNYGTKGIASSSNIPGSRSGAVSWKDSNDNLWLFGGAGIDSTGDFATGNIRNFNDLWKFDGVNWTWISGSNLRNQNGIYGTQGIASSSNVPGSRSGAVSWTDSNDNLWLFGGYGFAATGSFGYFNDLWKFNGTYWTWISGSNSTNQNGNYGTKGIASATNIPGSRVAPTSWTDSNDNLWLFGGYGFAATGNNGYFNDLWKFNGTYWTWISGSNITNQIGIYGTQGIASSSNIPGAHYSPVSWIDSNNNLYLFGGQGYAATGIYGNLNDLWKFDGMNWTWISGSNTTNQYGNYGTKGIASSSNVPGARYAAVSWTDSSNTFWLFGGSGFPATGNNGYLNDLWRFN